MIDASDELTLQHNTVLKAVVNKLRMLILTRRLKPGERLVQTELADQLGVSRTPVREALHQLAVEGLVTISPYKGASVAALSLEELQEIYTVRIALESYAARLVVRNITDSEIKVLKQLLHQMIKVHAKEEREELLEINRQFYLKFFEATRQQRLYDMIVNHLDLSHQYRRLAFYLDYTMTTTIQEHQKLIELLEKRDESGIEALFRIGLEAVEKDLTRSLESGE
jgi:DNA-binding GntR family transcriptional regulator